MAVPGLHPVQPDTNVDGLGLGGHVGTELGAPTVGQQLDPERGPGRHRRHDRPGEDGHLAMAIGQGRRQPAAGDRLARDRPDRPRPHGPASRAPGAVAGDHREWLDHRQPEARGEPVRDPRLPRGVRRRAGGEEPEVPERERLPPLGRGGDLEEPGDLHPAAIGDVRVLRGEPGARLGEERRDLLGNLHLARRPRDGLALAVHRRSGDARRAAVVASDATSCRVKQVAAAFGADVFRGHPFYERRNATEIVRKAVETLSPDLVR